jgi:hypothetical protein
MSRQIETPMLTFMPFKYFDQKAKLFSYHDGDEDGADWIGDHPVECVDQQRRDDHTHAAQSVGKNMQEDLKVKTNLIFCKNYKETLFSKRHQITRF